ncbi:MAG: PHP domain-containing protein [bacterium]|nr:PHP domain-containing protein [bacterium]
MQNIKEIFSNITKDDYEHGLVNLHIHTKFSDGSGEPRQILDYAKNNGYKYISITDHNCWNAHYEVSDEMLITGAEFDCWHHAIFMHLLAYGFDINNPEMEKFMAKNKEETESAMLRLFSKRNVADLINAIHHAGGIAVLAHPACYWAFSLDSFVKSLIKLGLDGIELYYPYPRFRRVVKFHKNSAVERIANHYPQLIRTGGTDFHGEIFGE